MEHIKRTFKKKDSLLREHKPTTLETNEKKRMARKEMLMKAMNKLTEPDIT